MKQAEIASKMNCSKSTICGIIKKLHNKGYNGCDKKPTREDKLYICPECGKNIISKKYRKHCSKQCLYLFLEKENKPTKEHLQEDMQTMNWSQIGYKYNTSHSTVIRWAKRYEIYKRKLNGQKVTK